MLLKYFFILNVSRLPRFLNLSMGQILLIPLKRKVKSVAGFSHFLCIAISRFANPVPISLGDIRSALCLSVKSDRVSLGINIIFYNFAFKRIRCFHEGVGRKFLIYIQWKKTRRLSPLKRRIKRRKRRSIGFIPHG